VHVNDIEALPLADEWPHQPIDDKNWQESVVLAFQDVDGEVGGFVRIGHSPSRHTGKLTFGLVSKEIHYTRSREEVELRESDRGKDSFGLDNFVTATFSEGTSRWVAEDDDCAIDIEVMDLHPQYDAWKLMSAGGDFHDDFASNHTEVGGTIRGSVRIGDRSWEINGFGFRDHSWGIRKTSEQSTRIANFFWLIGSFGSDMVFAIADVMLARGTRVRQGFVISHGVVELPVVKDACFTLELDGVSLRRADFNLWTPSLGTFDLQFEAFGNVLLDLGHDYLESGSPGRVLWGDKVGGAHISSMFNARGGSEFPKVLFNASAENGLSRPAGYGG
jgi:hypothetical protein